MTTAHAFNPSACTCACPPSHRDHHDRLRTVDVDMEELLALLEMAVTWYELDYTETPVLGPAYWATFAEDHDWTHPERAERAFSMAVDIVARAAESASPPAPLATVLQFVRG
jgi:hypothetical protein